MHKENQDNNLQDQSSGMLASPLGFMNWMTTSSVNMLTSLISGIAFTPYSLNGALKPFVICGSCLVNSLLLSEVGNRN